MSILIFFIVLFVLVLVHEWGHFIAAKKTGMRVDEFGIGFPPKLFGVKKGETEYTFNALPIGGFVKIFGENGAVSDVSNENEGVKTDGEGKADFAAQASITDATTHGRAFSDKPKWAQAVVLIAGVCMNVLFAWFLFTIVFVLGVPTAVDEASAGPEADMFVASVLPDSPAAELLPVGAAITVVSSGDRTLTDPVPSEFSEFVTTVAPAPVEITYVQGNETNVVEITPVQGLAVDEPERYLIGTSLSLVEIVQQPVHLAVREGFISTYEGLVAIASGLFILISEAIFGQADFSSVAGPVGIVGMVGDAAQFGFTTLLTFTAIISLNLAVINLLPFPALDGGRLVFVAIEAIARKEIPPVWAGRVNAIGFLLLLVLMAAVTYNDILRLL